MRNGSSVIKRSGLACCLLMCLLLYGCSKGDISDPQTDLVRVTLVDSILFTAEESRLLSENI